MNHLNNSSCSLISWHAFIIKYEDSQYKCYHCELHDVLINDINLSSHETFGEEPWYHSIGVGAYWSAIKIKECGTKLLFLNKSKLYS